MFRRWYRAMVVTLLLLTGDWPGVQLVSIPRELFGISGNPLDFGSVYPPSSRRDIHSVTWKLTSKPPRRIFQYIFSDQKMFMTTTYEGRVRFEPDSGSLWLLNITSRDTGTYQVFITDNQGLELCTTTRVHVHQALSGLQIQARWTTANISLSCSVARGTEPVYRWTKDGEDVEGNGQAMLSGDSHQLTLPIGHPGTCGLYTCLVQNPVSLESANYSIREADRFPFCGEQSHLNTRKFHISLTLIGIFTIGLLTICGVVLAQTFRPGTQTWQRGEPLASSPP